MMMSATKLLFGLLFLLLILIAWNMLEIGKTQNEEAPWTEAMVGDEGMSKSIKLELGTASTIFRYKLYQPKEVDNLAEVLMEGCVHTPNAPDKLELITGFIDFFRNKRYRQSIGDLARDSKENIGFIEARQMEVIDVLQSNLLHPVINRIHVIVWDKETALYLKFLALLNSHKLILRVIGKDVGLKEQLLYASECLPDRLIAITNQDNKIGTGWDNNEYKRILMENDIMYALTRHNPPRTNCTWLHVEPSCDDGVNYRGCHDTFVLRAKRWRPSVFKEIDKVTPDVHGMETLFIWFFHNRLKYRVINPCKKLFVYHHHCVAIRGIHRAKRVDINGKSMGAGFTDRFY